MKRVGLVVMACVLLSGCGSWWGGSDDKVKLAGTRIAVLSNATTSVTADPSLAGVPVSLPAAISTDWPQAGGGASHYLGHAALASDLRLAWSTGVGSGSSGQRRLLGQPIVADGVIFTVDATHQVTATDTQKGGRIWSVELEPEHGNSNTAAGGLAYSEGRLYVGTGFADVIALEAKTGKEIWRKKVSGPVRSAPAVAGGQVFAVSIDNRIHALSAADGEILWAHAGLSEAASLLGGAIPAVSDGIVVAPFSSGELFGIQAANGTPLWVETMGISRRTEILSHLNNIAGHPIINQGRVYVAGHGNVVAALNLSSGERLWQQAVGSTQAPWVAGDSLFMVSSAAELIALETAGGRVRWVQALDQWKDKEERSGRVVWTAPILAGGRLYLANSLEKLLVVSPDNGTILKTESLSGPVSVAPLVANGTLYILTDDATLLAYR